VSESSEPDARNGLKVTPVSSQQGGSDSIEQLKHGVGFASAREVIDEDIRIGDRHRQFLRMVRVLVKRPFASVSFMEPFNARAR
jgi:hypothetical protein